MDITRNTRIRPRQSTSTDRFLGAYSHDKADATTISAAGDELNEDDIFWTGESAAESLRHDTNSHNHNILSSLSSASRVNDLHNRIAHPKGGFAQPEGFGILAALPENETSSPNLHEFSHSFRRASVSSSSSSSSPSSSRLIPVIPKPPQDRITPISSVKYHQSAPVNVPMLSEAMRSPRDFSAELDADADDGDAEMLPPHEIVAGSLVQSPMLSCSVLEGAGRTLKGRDLRQVRNAVFRQTGFID